MTNIVFDKKQNCFILNVNDSERVVINDVELNFQMTRVSLRSERIRVLTPVKKSGSVEYPVNLRTIGSSQVITLSEKAGSFYAKELADSTLLGYRNDINESRFSPDQAMRLLISKLPGVDGSILYRNRSDEFQNFDCEGLWWSQTDFGCDLTKDFDCDSGLLAMWKYKDSLVAGMLPVTNKEIFGKLSTNHGDGISVVSGSGVSCQNIDDFPSVLIAFGQSPSEVIDKLLVSQRMLNPGFNLDSDEPLPEMFDKLGWCSWNAFGKNVTQDDIKGAIDTFVEKSIPVKYLLFDDGWLTVDSEVDDLLGEGISSSKLRSFEPDIAKFPDMKGLIEQAKQFGIENVGLWHTLNGYWEGIDKCSTLYKRNPDWFIENSAGDILPAGNTSFYKHWYSIMKEWGVDFVKVDNQAYHRRMLPYEKNLSQYMAQVQDSLNDASKAVGFPIIYCMATHPEIIFNSGTGKLLRISNDFKSDDPYSAKKHIVNNFYNTIWLGKILHPDFDMFQSYDCFAETYAKMLSISGSPIYLTDAPDKINVELLGKMTLPNGEIPRFDTLPSPLCSNFFEDPYKENNILSVYTKYNDTITLGLFNTVMTGEAVSGSIELSDLLASDKKYFMYSDSGNIKSKLVCGDDNLAFFVRNMDSDIITFAPVFDGFTAIGVTDYYATATLISSCEKISDGWEIVLKSQGNMLIYCEQEPSGIYVDDVLQEADNFDYSPQDGTLGIKASGKNIKVRF